MNVGEDIHEQQNENYECAPLIITNPLINKENYINELFTRMKFTKSHFLMILSVFLIRTIEGTEVFALALASNMIENSFDLAKNSSSLINVIILSGNFIGCFISMYISNKQPRKFLIKLGVILILIFGLFSIFTRDIVIFTILRHIVNIGAGLVNSSTVALIAESINISYRGFTLNLILVSGAVGEIFLTSFLGNLIDLENYRDWTKLFFLCLVPVRIIFF
jgi:MFS family permease